MYRIGSTVLAFLTAVVPMVAQEDGSPDPGRPITIGVAAWGTMNLHTGDFTTYDGILECGTFDDAQTPGWGLGYTMDLPFSNVLSLSARLYYWKGDGEFITPNPTPVRIAVDEQTIVPLQTEHALQTSLDYGMIDLLARWRFTDPLYVAVGPSAGFAARAAYEQEERILSPQGVTFLNGMPTRKIIAGNFDEQGTLNTNRVIRVGITGMIGAEIPLTRRLSLTPEAGFTFGVTSVLSSFDWTVHAIRAGVGIAYSLAGDRRPDTVLISGPDAVTPKPVLTMRAFNRHGGVDMNFAEVTIAEERSSDLVPLLPYVFFEPNASSIPVRYHRLNASSARSFTEEALRDSTLGIYHDLLNIVGSRLLRHTHATITLIGCREPLDDTMSTDALSTERATAIKNYLTSTWGIAADRIAVESRILPRDVSNRAVADGRQENRRVEIETNDPRIVAPVVTRSGGITVDPDALVIAPEIQFAEGVSEWQVSITSESGRELFTRGGVGQPDREVQWSLSERESDAIAASDASSSRLISRFTARTADGDELTAQRDIPVRRTFSSRRSSGDVVRDSLVERYSLIFFDFDAPTMSDFNSYSMDVIRNRMRTSSRVHVTGLTDRIGDDDHNLDLARRRAVKTSETIRARIVPEGLTNEGAGEKAIYNNDLPEGRMYNRTVIVEIVTPVADM